MAIETVEFLVNVELLRNQCQFNFEARRIGFYVQSIDTFALFTMRRRKNLRHPCANRRGERLDLGTTRVNHLVNAFSFAEPHVSHRLQSGIEQRRRVLFEGSCIEIRLGDDTRPAKNVDGTGCGRAGHGILNFCDACTDESNHFAVKLQFGLLVESPLEMERALNFATAQHGRNLLLELGFFWTQLVGQLELHIKVTMVDGTQFPRHCASRRLGGLPCKPCHTV